MHVSEDSMRWVLCKLFWELNTHTDLFLDLAASGIRTLAECDAGVRAPFPAPSLKKLL